MTEQVARSHNIDGMLELFNVDPGFSAFVKPDVIFGRQWSALLFELDFCEEGPQAVSAACASAGYSTAICMNIDANSHAPFQIRLDTKSLEEVHRKFHMPSYAIIEEEENFIVVSDSDYYWSILGRRSFIEKISDINWKCLLGHFEMEIEPYRGSSNGVQARIWSNLASYLDLCRSSFAG